MMVTTRLLTTSILESQDRLSRKLPSCCQRETSFASIFIEEWGRKWELDQDLMADLVETRRILINGEEKEFLLQQPRYTLDN